MTLTTEQRRHLDAVEGFTEQALQHLAELWEESEGLDLSDSEWDLFEMTDDHLSEAYGAITRLHRSIGSTIVTPPLFVCP